MKNVFLNRKFSDAEPIPGTVSRCCHCGLVQFKSSVSYRGGVLAQLPRRLLPLFQMALLTAATPFCCFSFIVPPFDQDYFLRKLWWSIIRKYPWTINEKATLIPITRQAHCWYAMSHTGGKAVFWVYNRRVYGNTWATRRLVGSRVKYHIPQIKSSFVEVVSVAFIHCNIWALGYH